MAKVNFTQIAVDLPKLLFQQSIRPLQLAYRKPLAAPQSQADLARMVQKAVNHEIRAGFSHRFIPLLFVTVGDRIFCRRYQYRERSWYDVFMANPEGQIKLDKTIADIHASVPEDLPSILPEIDKAYEDKLKQLGARFLLEGATNSRAQNSTIELELAKGAKKTF